MFQMRTTDGLITSRAVRTGTGGEGMVSRRLAATVADRESPSSDAYPGAWRQVFDESLTAEQHLSLDMFPGRTMADPVGDKGSVLPLGGRTPSVELKQHPVPRRKRDAQLWQ